MQQIVRNRWQCISSNKRKIIELYESMRMVNTQRGNGEKGIGKPKTVSQEKTTCISKSEKVLMSIEKGMAAQNSRYHENHDD